MPFLFILASLFSVATVFLADQYDWMPITLLLSLIGIALWCDLLLVYNAIAELRRVWIAFDYKPKLRHYDAPLATWVRTGYRQALIHAMIVTVFGVVLGILIGWLHGNSSFDTHLMLLVGASYAFPIFMTIPYLAHRYAEAQHFAAERLDVPPLL